MSSMVSLTDTSAFAWIADGRDVPNLQGADSPTWNGNTVAHCIPRIFEAYCKLFHPIHEDVSIHDHAITWDEERRANHATIENEPGEKALAAILSDSVFVRQGGGIEAGPETRLLWRTAAERYGLVFHPEFNDNSFRKAFVTGSWPRHLLGPTEGTLDRRTCEALIDVLKPFSQKQTIFFRFSDYLMNDLPHLYAGNLNEATSFLTKSHFGGTPESWWSEDRNWCVHTDWDLTFTLVGGSRAVVDACLEHPVLECLEVKPETRIDYRADRLNLPKSQPVDTTDNHSKRESYRSKM